jgi:hypothetical protein
VRPPSKSPCLAITVWEEVPETPLAARFPRLEDFFSASETRVRRTQSDANCSPRQIPCLAGKEQGTIRISELPSHMDGQKSPVSLHNLPYSHDIPYLQDQGKFHHYQGMFPRYQGNFGSKQATLHFVR